MNVDAQESNGKLDLSTLDPRAEAPLYQQIYLRLRNAIAEGLIRPGERIPAARALARELGLARGTIETAYGLLAAEGYVQARGQAGTVVMEGVRHHAAAPASTPPVRHPQPPVQVFGDYPEGPRPFQMGLPALDAFPRKIWARLAARCARAIRSEDLAYPAMAGLAELRAAVTGYLRVSRGIDCAPGQVFITSGYRQTLQLVARAVMQAGETAWVEDPCYLPTHAVLRESGMILAPVPVDDQGLNVEQGAQIAPGARLAVVTPAHQSPLCVSLSLPRRLALLEWAARRDAWILEDDYDGEYRFQGRPLPALKSLDGDGRVIYSGTFSKVLTPGIRLAYFIAPPSLVPRFTQLMGTFGGGVPQLTQAIVTAFMKEGHFARHIQRMRKLYAERRDFAAAGLGDVLGEYMQVDPQPGGMHLVLRGKGVLQDGEIAQRMRERQMFAHALSDCYMNAPTGSALLLSFTNIVDREHAQALARQILPLLA